MTGILPRISWISGTAWSTFVLFGLFHLQYPMHGDQALYLTYARGLDEGARLYVDLWINKQPGVLWFYLTAGRLFGFSEFGVHAFELLWLFVATWVLWLVGRASFESRGVANLLPLLTGALYYWHATPQFLGQIEILVSLPLALCIAASVNLLRDPKHGLRWALLFGACSAVVALFKLILVLAPLLMGLVALAYLWMQEQPNRVRRIIRLLAYFGLGFASLLVPTAWYFHATGGWQAFLWTQLTYPTLAVVEVQGKDFWKFYRGSAWLKGFLPTLLLFWWAARAPKRPALRIAEAQSIAWIGAAILAIALQRFSYWPYHFLLLLMPVGVLVCSATDRILASNATRNRKLLVGLTIAAVFFIGGAYPLAARYRAVQAAIFATRGEGLDRFRDSLDPGYLEAKHDTSFLQEPGSLQGPIYVFGNPNLLLMSGRPQAIPIDGWSWQLMLKSQWRELPGQLASAKPAYVYVSAFNAKLISERSDQVKHLLETEYVPELVRSSAQTLGTWYPPGTWYRRDVLK